MRLPCVRCGAEVPAADFDLDRRRARCRVCGERFAIDAALAVALRVPEGITVELGNAPEPEDANYRTAPAREAGRLVLTRRWRRGTHAVLLGFAIVWDGFLLIWYALAAYVGAPAWAFVVPLLHVALGGGITYASLAGVLNRTIIRVERDRLTVQHGPLAWWGNVSIPTHGLRRVLVVARENVTPNIWDVSAESSAGIARLVSRISDRHEADYIARAIATHLGVEHVRDRAG